MRNFQWSFDKSEFGKRSLARNPLLADLVHRSKIVEKIGSGINRVKEALHDRVTFEFFSAWFRVVISRSEKYPENINDTQRAILNLIDSQKTISKEAIAKNVGISLDGVKKSIRLLKEKGLLIRVGQDKGGHWEVKR